MMTWLVVNDMNRHYKPKYRCPACKTGLTLPTRGASVLVTFKGDEPVISNYLSGVQCDWCRWEGMVYL